MKIRSKILIYYNFIILSSIFILGGIILSSLNNYIIQNTVKRLSDRVLLSQEIYLPEYSAKNVENSFKEQAETIALNLSKNNLHVRIYDKSGLLKDASSGIVVTYSLDNFKQSPAVDYALSGKNAYIIENDMIYFAVPVKADKQIIGAIEYIEPLNDELKIINYFKKMFIYSSLICLILVLIVGFYISNIITKPIKELDEAAKKFVPGNLNYLKIKSKDEIGSLSNSFNSMEKSINTYVYNIQSEKAKLDLVLSNINEGIAAISKNGEIIFKNPVIDSLGQNILETLINIKDSCFKYGHVVEDLNLKDKIFKIDASIHNDTCIIVIHDITSERQMINKQKNFVSNISHELKTPITAIMGYTELLKSEKEYDKMAVEYLYSESLRLKNLVLELLEVSRLDSYESKLDKRTVNLSQIVKSIVENMCHKASKYNIDIKNSIEEDIIAYLDANKISQSIINLIDNAIKYSNPGGTIQIKLYSENNFNIIEVKDSGIGISEEDKNKIFERFYRCENAKEIGGSGLGLPIVKEIIEKHGGSISVESELNKGSNFIIKLPQKMDWGD